MPPRPGRPAQPGGRPLNAARVDLQLASGPKKTGETDERGHILFVNLSPERVTAGHTLQAQLGGIPDRLGRYPLADLRTARRISHVFVLDVPTYAETLFVTDAAMATRPSK